MKWKEAPIVDKNDQDQTSKPENVTTNTQLEWIEQQMKQTKQNARLRERMLKFYFYAIGHPVIIKLVENITVSGQFSATDGKQQRVEISNLKTPMFTYKEALLRTTDMIYLQVFPMQKKDQ